MKSDILDQKVAIVTGAGSGIGEATAIRFADEGASVVIADICPESAEKTKKKICNQGRDAIVIETDITEIDDVHLLIDETITEYDKIDILVNNAGNVISDQNPHKITEEYWEQNMEVNLKGHVFCAREVIPVMADGGGGSLVHMSSINGLFGMGLTAYSAAKGGLIPFSALIANQYGRFGIRSNVICPGEINTKLNTVDEQENLVVEQWLDQFPIGRFGKPEEVANVALFLASEEASYVTGTKIVVDGGFMAGPDHTLEKMSYGIDEKPT